MGNYNGSTFACLYNFVNRFGLPEKGKVYVSALNPDYAYLCAKDTLSTTHNHLIVDSVIRTSYIELGVRHIVDYPETSGGGDIFQRDPSLTVNILNQDGSIDLSTFWQSCTWWPICQANRDARMILSYASYSDEGIQADVDMLPGNMSNIFDQVAPETHYEANEYEEFKIRFFTGPEYNPILGPIFHLRFNNLLADDGTHEYNDGQEYPPGWEWPVN